MTSPANVFVVVPPEGKRPTGYAALVNADGTPWEPGGESSVAWGDVTDKPATFTPTIGTSADTAMAGDTLIPTAAGEISADPVGDGTAQNVQGILEELETRIAALEAV